MIKTLTFTAIVQLVCMFKYMTVSSPLPVCPNKQLFFLWSCTV